MNLDRTLLWCACLSGALILLPGCSSPPPTVEDAPFRLAITEYLTLNNMALKIKAIKTGPEVDGDQATLSASLTHEQLGGPSVTWHFQFQRQSSGDWQVTAHED